MRTTRALDLDHPATFALQRPYYRAVLASLDRFRGDCEALREFAVELDPALRENLDGILWALRTFDAMLAGQAPPALLAIH